MLRAKATFAAKPFNPHPWLKTGHGQTLGAFAWPRRWRFRATDDTERIFEVNDDVKVLAHCRWQKEPANHATVVIWHGIEGSSASNYMLGTAHKAFRVGFNVIRMNLRTCGGTEHLTPSIYHGGLTEDLHAVVEELIEKDHLSRLFLVGFSLGGNMVLKLAGEYGANPPPEVLGVCAVSPSVDLQQSAASIMLRFNWLYERDFLWRLKRRIRRKHQLFPDAYDISNLSSIRTLKQFDDRFTSRAHGFDGADDYYFKASSMRVIDKIHISTLIIHAQDDPFIPFAPLREATISNNPYILLLDPERGGHVAFVSANASLEAQDSSLAEDRFWAENRVVEYCRLANDEL